MDIIRTVALITIKISTIQLLNSKPTVILEDSIRVEIHSRDIYIQSAVEIFGEMER